MTYYTRAQWGARARSNGPGSLHAGQVEGIALHWPAMGGRIDTIDEAMAALRNWQAFHMDGRGWSDIAYQEAVDQLGNVYELRGLSNRSAANGGTDVNGRFGALLLLLGPGEHPTEEMIAAVRSRIARQREIFPFSKRVVGHGQIRPGGGTECPGPITQGLIDAGAFEPREARPPSRGSRIDAALRKLWKAQRRADRHDQPIKKRRIQKARQWLKKIRER